MTRQIIAIGGGGFGRNPGRGVIETYILKQAKNRIQTYALFQLQLVITMLIK